MLIIATKRALSGQAALVTVAGADREVQGLGFSAACAGTLYTMMVAYRSLSLPLCTAEHNARGGRSADASGYDLAGDPAGVGRGRQGVGRERRRGGGCRSYILTAYVLTAHVLRS